MVIIKCPVTKKIVSVVTCINCVFIRTEKDHPKVWCQYNEEEIKICQLKLQNWKLKT